MSIQPAHMEIFAHILSVWVAIYPVYKVIRSLSHQRLVFDQIVTELVANRVKKIQSNRRQQRCTSNMHVVGKADGVIRLQSSTSTEGRRHLGGFYFSLIT